MKLVKNMFVNVYYSYFDYKVVVYGLKWHCRNISVVVEFLEMTQCPCENVSLIFCFFKCCADMSRRNTSQRPPEPPQDRSDRLRAGRPAPTSSARREKQALHPPMAGRGRGGGRDLLELMLHGGQRHRRVHRRWWTWHSINKIIRCMSRRRIRRIILRSLSLTSIILMCISIISMRIIMSSLILSKSSSMIVGVMLRGCRWWCTRPDRTTMEGGLLTSHFYLALVDMWHAGYGSMPM